MRVQKIIANSGLCSRRKAEELIEEGKVKVNGKVVKIGDVAELTYKIVVEGKELNKTEYKYMIMNKPKNYVTSLSDPFEQTIADLLPERISPCGRLDKDAEGLLLLTNNGDLAHKIMHPSYEIEKVYIARTDKPIKQEILSFINKYGVVIKDGYVDAKIYKIAQSVYEVKIHVGYHKVVKKIFDKFNVRVKLLTRTRLGPLRLEKLKRKEWKYLTPSEAKKLEDYVNKLIPHKQNRREYYKRSLDFKYAFKDLMGEGSKHFKQAYIKPKEEGRLKKKKYRAKEEEKVKVPIKKVVKEMKVEKEKKPRSFESWRQNH